MPTRSVVARGRPDGSWAGVFVSWDGFPSVLGREMYAQWKIHFEGDGERLLEFVERFPQGFYRFPDQPYANGTGTHLTYSGCVQGCSDKGCDPLFIEWVYALREAQLTVFMNIKSDPDDPKAWWYPSVGFAMRHIAVGTFDLSLGQPDWERLENEWTIQRREHNARIAEYVP